MVVENNEKSNNDDTLFLLVIASIGNAIAAVPEWLVYSNPGVPADVTKSKQAVRGQQIAAIKPPLQPIENDTLPRDIDRYTFGWMDYFYLAQT